VFSQRPDFGQIVRCEVYRSLDEALGHAVIAPSSVALLV
jgi:hypothetical protein